MPLHVNQQREVVRFGVDGFQRMVAVPSEDLRQHLYIVGQTGVGKITMLRNIRRGRVWRRIVISPSMRTFSPKFSRP